MLNVTWDVHIYEREESSNLIVKSEIDKGTAPGFVAIVHEQTGGYGMRGHTWASPKGGLYFSLLLETSLGPDELPTIPMRFAKALLEGLQPYSTEELTIKPQNDIVLARSFTPDFREKLVGISTELYRGKLCVGIGVNVLRPNPVSESVVSAETASVTTALRDDFGVTVTEEREARLEVPGAKIPQGPSPINVPVYLQDFAAKELDVDGLALQLLSVLNDKLTL